MAGQRVDQVWSRANKRFVPSNVPAYDGQPRLGIVTVNFSTTRYLALLLLTLCEQRDLRLVHRIAIVDNGSRDGGREFADRLERAVPRVHVVKNRYFLNHARGMRAGVRVLDRADRGDPKPVNMLLFLDTDVIFRDPSAIGALADAAAGDAALVGQLSTRTDVPHPFIHASFFAVRRDVYGRRDIEPLVYHGSPASWQQQSIAKAGLRIVDFPSYRGGYALHRGRSGYAASVVHRPWHPTATKAMRDPHFSGVPDGEAIWREVESRHAPMLEPAREAELIDVLATRLAVLGTDGE